MAGCSGLMRMQAAKCLFDLYELRLDFAQAAIA